MYAIYDNIYHQYTPNVSIYIPYMDPMGMIRIVVQVPPMEAALPFWCFWALPGWIEIFPISSNRSLGNGGTSQASEL